MDGYGFTTELVEQIILIYKWPVTTLNIKNKAHIHQGHHGMFHGVIMFNSDFTANLVCSG